MKVAIQCVDRRTGDIGSFGHFGDFIAVTPVYDSLVTLYSECARMGIELDHSI